MEERSAKKRREKKLTITLMQLVWVQQKGDLA